jgi:Ni/Co efflux regulator RcnB
MKRILIAAAALSVLAGGASAQPGHDDHRDRDRGGQQQDNHDRFNRRGGHEGWRKGHRVDRRDWSRGHRVDYRRHHLRRPPRGYEWREIDGDYVLGAIATGLILDLLINHH